jgi:hypothetical protein
MTQTGDATATARGAAASSGSEQNLYGSPFAYFSLIPTAAILFI